MFRVFYLPSLHSVSLCAQRQGFWDRGNQTKIIRFVRTRKFRYAYVSKNKHWVFQSWKCREKLVSEETNWSSGLGTYFDVLWWSGIVFQSIKSNLDTKDLCPKYDFFLSTKSFESSFAMIPWVCMCISYTSKCMHYICM